MKQVKQFKQGSLNNFLKRKFDVISNSSSGEGPSNEIPQTQTPQPSQGPSNEIPQTQTPQPSQGPSNEIPQTQTPQPSSQGPQPNEIPKNFDVNNLPSDPAERPPITFYHPNQRDEIRRAYLIKGACQPKGHIFPSTKKGTKRRRFVVDWFGEFEWLEYSIKEDEAYCLCCYLFRDSAEHQGGSKTFVTDGFNNWSKKDKLYTHVGEVGSYHNKAREKCELLLRNNQSIGASLHKQTALEKSKYEIRLPATIDICKLLLRCSLPFRGHDESDESHNRGLFLEMLTFLRNHNESIYNVTLENAPKNDKLTSPTIQKDVVECFANEIIKSICDDLGDDIFSLLVDESSDVSGKEQMAIVLRYVDKSGMVKERFIGVVHVKDTSSLTLKNAIDSVFTKNKLTISQLRGQGYDGASNMRGAFNGLKALILKENDSAHYIHCFSHQLQLVVVAVAKKHEGVKEFFEYVALVVTVVCASCKRKDIIREKHKTRVEAAIKSGEIESGSGLNQETSLIRAGDTRWGSHYKTLMSLETLFEEVVSVLEYVEEDGSSLSNRCQAKGILTYFKTVDFVFYLHLMLEVLGRTDTLSKHLQRKDQDILEAASLVRGTKLSLQTFRSDGFNPTLMKVTSFCQKYHINMVDMEANYVTLRNRRTNNTNRFHFEVGIFNTVLDMQMVEFGERFSEVTTDLIENMAALSPCDSFCKFDKEKLVKLSASYKHDFNDSERSRLPGQLDTYYHSVTNDDKFANLKGISELARLMVETGKNRSFSLVYKLVKLALVLPVATATVERCFSAMKLLKTDLRNKMSDEFMNDALICSVEHEALTNVTTENVITRFQKMKDRRGHL